MPNFLNLTNLTDTPLHDIHANVDSAIEDYNSNPQEKDLTKEQEEKAHSQIDFVIDDFEENGKVADILSFVDNLIVNYDYAGLIEEVAQEN